MILKVRLILRRQCLRVLRAIWRATTLWLPVRALLRRQGMLMRMTGMNRMIHQRISLMELLIMKGIITTLVAKVMTSTLVLMAFILRAMGREIPST